MFTEHFTPSIKLLKTSSIMFHSSSESSGIGCTSPSVPSSFSMNEVSLDFNLSVFVFFCVNWY